MKKKNLSVYQTPLLEVINSFPENDILVVSTGETYNDGTIYDDENWNWD